MGKILHLSGVLFIVCCCGMVFGATWYVATPPLGSDSNPGTAEEPLESIQAALDAAADQDTILVAEGTYVELIQFNGKNVVLRSSDPLDAGVVERTIIDGDRISSVVTFLGIEDETCVLAGFTIQNGGPVCSCMQDGGGISGGTKENHTRATIRNNVVTANNASEGGGLAYCDGTIEDNRIVDNDAWGGGGLAHCNALIRGNTISDNSAILGGGLLYCEGTIENNVISGNMGHGGGGGLDGCSGTIENNVIRDNWTEQDESAGGGLNSCNGIIRGNRIMNNASRCDGGGGLAHCDGLIANNLVYGNTTDGTGGGMIFCEGTVVNNTVYGNTARWSTGGLAECSGVIRDCILWGNIPAEAGQLYECVQPTHSCIQNWGQGGQGNTAAYPCFVDPEAGDFHLQSWSPCVDAGDPSSDFSQEPQPNGGKVNLGAYGNTSEAATRSPDSDEDGLPDDWEQLWFGNLEQNEESDPDGDRIPNRTERRYAWDPTTPSPTLAENMAYGECYQTIQAAISEAQGGDVIFVYPGFYAENIAFPERNIVLRSTDPYDSAVVAATILDGGNAGPVVSFSGGEDETCVLAGFTIQNGRAFMSGGGIWGAGCHATILNNVITGNSADSGGGIASCYGAIRNNVIYRNSAGYAGGLAYCHGIIDKCTIAENSGYWGGGLHDCDGTISNCIIWGNVAERDDQIFSSSEPTYSCIQDWAGEGEGNISQTPHFVDPDWGDFHLETWSPCIDMGNPNAFYLDEPEPNGGRVNMGGYGNTPGAASKSPDIDEDGLPDTWEIAWFGGLQETGDGDPDGDNISNEREYLYGWQPLHGAATSVQNTRTGQWYQTIGTALKECEDGDEIIAYPGVYTENIRFQGKNIVLRSESPTDPWVVSQTVLNGASRGAVVAFSGSEDATCVLAGFTIRNGRANLGGGVHGAGTRATIRHNIIDGNVAMWRGGGICGCDGLIENNVVSGNSAQWEGGGLAECDGVIRNNLIVGNTTQGDGGGLYLCKALIQNNTICGNVASETAGSGLAFCDGPVENCIIWGNASGEESPFYYGSQPVYSCVQDWTGGGEGNITEDPQFVDPVGPDGDASTVTDNDYRLASTSPCVDAGRNDAWMSEAFDLVGNPRVAYGRLSATVDMGAYERPGLHFGGLGITKSAGAGFELHWASEPGKTYTILSCAELESGVWTNEAVVVSQSESCFWVDPDTSSNRKFYRILRK